MCALILSRYELSSTWTKAVPRKGVLSLHYEAEPGTEAFEMRLRMATEVLGWEFEPSFDVKKWTKEEIAKDRKWRARRQAAAAAAARGTDKGAGADDFS